jgi:hypothetical protein
VEEPIVVHRIGRAWTNLFEVPVLFVAVCLVIVVLHIDDATFANLGWAFVAFRLAHFAVFVTVNHAMVRFVLFVVSVLILAAMAVRVVSIAW